MQLNYHSIKQANEVIFSRKSNNCSHPTVAFNNNDINKYPHHKYYGIVLDSKLNLKFHVDQKTTKSNRLIGLIRRLSAHVRMKSFLTIYKLFIRPHFDYGDISYDKPENENFPNKLEKVQYRARFVITGAIQKTSRQNLSRELGLHSLSVTN